MEAQIHKENNALRVSFEITDQAGITQAIEMLAKLARADLFSQGTMTLLTKENTRVALEDIQMVDQASDPEFSENSLSTQLPTTYEEVGTYHH